MVLFLRWMLYYYALFRTSASDLSCSANRDCFTMRNLICRFHMVEPYADVTHFTQKSIPSSPICHNITAVQHRNDSAILLNVTWSGPADGSVGFLQGFLLSVMSSDSINPKVRYLVNLTDNARFFKNESLFNTIRRGVFSVLCNYTRVRKETLDFYIRSLPSPEDGDNNLKECWSTLQPYSAETNTFDYTTTSPLVTWQNRSNPDYITTSPLVTRQNRSSPVKIKTSLAKHDVHRKWNVVIISAVSAVVCSLIFVVISLTLWRRRRTVIPRSSETEGESIVPESSSHTEGESIVPESSFHTEGESIVPESSSHTEGESIVPESSLCVSKKQIAPKSSDSVITPDSRISHVKELSSGQSEATSGDSIYDEDIIQEMLRINFADKIDSHGYM